MVTDDEWTYIFNNETNSFRTYTYVNFFTKKLNNIGITCVLVAGHKYNRYSVQFKCKHETCTRMYKLVSYEKDLEFAILFDGDVSHPPKAYITRPLNNDNREAAKTDLRSMGVREFAKKRRDEANRNLTSQGNMDTIKGKEVYANLKSVVLSENDLDKDHIVDLSKLRKKQLNDVEYHVPGSEVYIQHVASNDFYVHAFSSTQIKVLRKLLSSGQVITIHCDATGSIIRAPEGVEKRIYYYVFSCALPILDEETKILFPLIEMISSAHDAFTIETWINRFKDQFKRQVGTWIAPDQFVTDFSFAILNAASASLNNEELIDSINRMYDELNQAPATTDETVMVDQLPSKMKKTTILICNNHFMKTAAQDVDAHFPPDQSSTIVRSFLKETFALILNMTDLNNIANVYRNLSTILNSKYLTSDVTSAINFISNIVKNKKKDEKITSTEAANEEDEENIEILRFDEVTNDAMHRQSKFYQMFKKITVTPNYDNTIKTLNNFYCPKYCDLLLSKYIAILPLWTCLNCSSRISNANAESLFKIIKSLLTKNVDVIGKVPIRSSRFLKFTRNLINEWAAEFWEQLPRTQLCNKKRQRSTSNSPQVNKRSRRSSQSPVTPRSTRLSSVTPTNRTSQSASVTPTRIMSQLYSVTPTRPLRVIELSQSESSMASPRRMSQSSSNTPTRRLSQSVSVTSRPLRSIKQSGNKNESPTVSKSPRTPICSSSSYLGDSNAEESWGPKRRRAKPKHSYYQFNLLKNLDTSKLFETEDNRVSTAANLKNYLIDDPSLYIKPNSKFVVASVPNTSYTLSSNDYKSLQPNEKVTRECVDFILQLLTQDQKRKDTQFIFFDSVELTSAPTKIRRDNVIGILSHLGVYSVLILNLKKKMMAYIDLKLRYPTNQMLNNVLEFLERHNEKYKTSYELQGWNDTIMKYPTLVNGNDDDSGVYILRFIHDLIIRNTISSREFDVNEFRSTLSHYVLNKSGRMIDLCLICGRKEDDDDDPIIDWMKCEKCGRWCHDKCLQTTTFKVAFHCILCT